MTITERIQKVIEQVKELDAKATKGPWNWRTPNGAANFYRLLTPDGKSVHDDGSACGEYSPEIDVKGPDAEFIARSRAILPLMARLLEVYERYTRDRLATWPFTEMRSELDAILGEAK